MSRDQEIRPALTQSFKYGNSYIDATAEGEQIVMITKGNEFYMLFPAEKSGIGGTGEGDTEEQDLFVDFSHDDDYTTGEMTIEGKSYYYEEYVEDDGENGTVPVRYCFDGDMLAYIVNYVDEQESFMKVTSFDENVSDSLFEVPSDYEIMMF